MVSLNVQILIGRLIFFHGHRAVEYILKITARCSLDQHSLILVSIPIKLPITSRVGVLKEKLVKYFEMDCNAYERLTEILHEFPRGFLFIFLFNLLSTSATKIVCIKQHRDFGVSIMITSTYS